MNNSGSAVAKLVPRDSIDKLIVVHDDIDLPFGEIKLAKGRGAGGNNGVQSIISKLNSKDFIRLRVGIAPKGLLTGKVKRPAGGGPLERFVLKPFSLLEKRDLNHVLECSSQAIKLILTKGLDSAMNEVN
jgi:PTH1 family peptidyl-tRNA hydrolase